MYPRISCELLKLLWFVCFAGCTSYWSPDIKWSSICWWPSPTVWHNHLGYRLQKQCAPMAQCKLHICFLLLVFCFLFFEAYMQCVNSTIFSHFAETIEGLKTKPATDSCSCSILVAMGQDNCNFFSEEGFPRNPSPKAWKGETGLYIAGLGRKGILGSAFDAKNIADDISQLFFAAELESHARVQPVPQQQQQQLLRKPQMLQVPSFQPNAPTTQPPQLHTPMN